MLSDFLYYLLLKPLSKLPLSILYIFSDGLKFVLKDLLKYRRKVVEANLTKVYPNLSEAELTKTVSVFYAHLSDLIVEGVKSFSISEKELWSRVKILNKEIFDKPFKANRSVILVSAHCNNWEWPAILGPGILPHELCGFYKTIKNKTIDEAVRKSRSQLGLILSSIDHTYESFVEREKTGRPHAYLMLADQSPSKIEKAHWVNFLGIETACHHGPAHYAQTYDMAIFYVHIDKKERGYYEVLFEELIDDPNSLSPEEITEKYMKAVEAFISKNPAHWLWSHKRWKHVREE